jgi:transposase-like protein
MKCPKCESDEKAKDGIVKQKQRYKCKECNFRYTVSSGSGAKPLYLRKLALQFYLEGLGFRSIGRVLGVSNVTVLNWIRTFGEQVAELKGSESVIYTEMDEMHTYVGQKKAIIGYGLLLIDMGKNSSISLLATEALRLGKSSGIRLKIS